MVAAIAFTLLEWLCAAVMAVFLVAGVFYDLVFLFPACAAAALGLATRSLMVSRASGAAVDRAYRHRLADDERRAA